MEFVENVHQNELAYFGDIVEIDGGYYIVMQDYANQNYPILRSFNGENNVGGAKDFESLNRYIKKYNGQIFKNNKYRLQLVKID